MNIEVKNIMAAYEAATDSERTLLRNLFPILHLDEKEKDYRPVTERIKTFKDACNELGNDHPFVLAYQNTIYETQMVEQENSDIIAYLKLRIICAALNEGWTPRFTEEEVRWYPLFYLWTDDELSDKSDEWKEAHALISTDHYIGEWAGFASAYSNYTTSCVAAAICPRLYLKSEAIATYCGKQFIELWKTYLLLKK